MRCFLPRSGASGTSRRFPKGYKVQIAAAYLAYIFSRFPRAEDYAKQYIKDHGLSHCSIGEQLVHILRQFDRYLLVDKLEGWINWPSTEYLCRRAYGIELAFAKCKSVNDWLQPVNAGKDWRSKVDWGAADRVDPDEREQHQGFRLEELEEEVRHKTEHDALLAKSKSKLKEYVTEPIDKIKPGPLSD